MTPHQTNSPSLPTSEKQAAQKSSPGPGAACNYYQRSGRTEVGGTTFSPAAYDAGRVDSSILAEYAQPRGNFSQTLIDVATIFFCALFVTVTGVGLAFALFVLFFVKVQ